MNKHAKRAEKALKVGGYKPESEGPSALVDLMADLFHYGIHKGYSLQAIELCAKGHWAYEQKYPKGGGPL